MMALIGLYSGSSCYCVVLLIDTRLFKAALEGWWRLYCNLIIGIVFPFFGIQVVIVIVIVKYLSLIISLFHLRLSVHNIDQSIHQIDAHVSGSYSKDRL
jgi:hypothetical protein